METHKVNACKRSENNKYKLWNIFQEIFKKIHDNHNEEVYLKDVVVFLRAAYEDIDEKYEVNE